MTLGGSSREYGLVKDGELPSVTGTCGLVGVSETREERESGIRAAILSLSSPLPTVNRSEQEVKAEGDKDYESDDYGIVEYGSSSTNEQEVFLPNSSLVHIGDRSIQRQVHGTPEIEAEGAVGEQRNGKVGDSGFHQLIPTSHSFLLKPHRRTVTCVGVDPGGGRLASGSLDTYLRLFDFGGLDKRGEAFKEVTPFDDRPVSSLAWSPVFSQSVSGSFVAVASAGGSKVALIDKEGGKVLNTVAGDSYLADTGKTKGHTTDVTGLVWAAGPGGWGGTGAALYSSSRDGTVRTWDCVGGKRSVFKELECVDVIKFKRAGSGGSGKGITAFSLSFAGDVIVAALDDGSLGAMGVRGTGSHYTGRLDGVASGGHQGGVVTSLSWCNGGTGHKLASRGTDGRCILWDARMWSSTQYLYSGSSGGAGKVSSLGVIEGCPTASNGVTLAWSPCGRFLLVGGDQKGWDVKKHVGDGSSGKVEGGGLLWAWDVPNLETLFSTGATASPTAALSPSTSEAYFIPQPAPVSAVSWHPKINQVVIGYVGGAVGLLYSPEISIKGALIAVARGQGASAPSKSSGKAAEEEQQSMVREGAIFAPNALRQYQSKEWVEMRGGGGGKKGKQTASGESLTTAPTPVPTAQPGKEHPVWSKQTFTDHYLRAHPEVLTTNLRAQDPQKVLQGYAGMSAGFTSVYSSSQPKTLLAEQTLEEELERASKKSKT